jgi:F420-non-reducing hydrogenase iron-sulfur subunit
MADKTFEPRILAFCCNWCSYSGADLCGVSRFQYPPNIRIIRVMCSGRVEPIFVLKAFSAGMDGVLVMGCHPGDCHYINGNESAVRQMDKAFELCRSLGIDKRRMRLEWVSASEGKRFSEVVTEFTEQVRKLGPTGLGREGGGEG